jgi:tetratricopeptide (TPR) repeat protein
LLNLECRNRTNPIKNDKNQEGDELMHQGQLVVQYRENIGQTQEWLAAELGVDVRTVQRLERTAMIRSNSRRWFLVGLLGIPASDLNLTGEPPWSKKKRLPVNDDVIGFFESELGMRWQVYKSAGPNFAVQGMDMWMSQVKGLVRSTQGTPWYVRAMTILCLSYQLDGSILRDMGAFTQAHQSMKNASQVARELDDPELKASSLLRMGTTYIREALPLDAIACFNEGLNGIKGRSFPNLRGSILQARAEAHAIAQQSQECWASIGLAEHIFGREEKGHEQSFVSFNAPKATSYKGIYALLLGDYERSLSLFDKGLASYNPRSSSSPQRVRFLARKAEAHYGARQISESIETAQQAFDLATIVGEHTAVERVRALHATLLRSKWSKETGMQRLGASITTYDVGQSKR